MNTTNTPTRTATRAAGLATTATTVMALLALASAARMIPIGEVLVVHESRTAVRESAVVRAVAVAVAAAKDLLGVDQTTSTFDMARPMFTPQPRVNTVTVHDDRSAQLHGIQLDERLLDLPPPMA